MVNIALPHIQIGTALLRDQPVLGAERVHADVRRAAAARRPGRRHPRPPPDVPRRDRHLHARLAGRRPRHRPPGCCSRPAPCRASAARSPRPPCSRWWSAASPRAGSGPGRSPSTPRVVTGGGSLGLVLGGLITQWLRPGAGCCSSTCRSASRWSPLTPLFVTETPRQPGRFDLAGAITSTAGVAALVYGFIRAASDGWGDRLGARRVRGGGGAARGLPAATRPGRRSRSRRCGCSPTPAGPARSSARLLLVARHVRDVLLPDPVPAGRARLQPAAGRPRVPADDPAAVRGVPRGAAADAAVRRRGG